MTALTDLIKAGEGYNIEFKENLGKIDKEVVAFANASGGRILLGVADDGTVRGFTDSNTNRSRLQNMARNCEPPIEIEMAPLEGILVVDVKEGDNKPYSCRGRFYIRQGPNSQRMSREEIFTLAVYDGTIKYDSQIHPRFRYPEDFDERKFEQYLEVARIARPERPEGLLQSLGVCNDEMRFNNAGVLFFAKDPYRFIKTSRLVCALFGHSRADILDRKNFDEGVVENILEAINYVTRHTDVRFVIKSAEREEIPDYPEEAYREAIVNAVIHRDYFDTTGDVVVEVHTKSVRVTNPGGLVKGLNEENFGTVSKPRNNIMTDLMLRTIYVEKLGSGIRRMRRACREAGNPLPEFTFDRYNFAIEFGKKGEVEEEYTPEVTPHVTPHVTPQVLMLLKMCMEPQSRNDIQSTLNISDRKHLRTGYITPLIEASWLAMTIPDKPRSRRQKYVTTEEGKIMLDGAIQDRTFDNVSVEFDNNAEVVTDDTPRVTPHVTPYVTPYVTPQVLMLLKMCMEPRSRNDIQSVLNISDRKHLRTVYITPLIEASWLSMIIPDKPRSSKQKYVTTEMGKEILKGTSQENNESS